MVRKMTKTKKGIDYESEILDYINTNPSGITIADIITMKGYARNTVSKYVTALEREKKIFFHDQPVDQVQKNPHCYPSHGQNQT